MFKLKEAKLIYLSLILFCQIFIIGIWSNPSLNASISPDSYDYITLSNNLFDENSNFRPPIYPLFLKLSSLLGELELTKKIFLMQITLHSLNILICFLFLNYIKVNPFIALIICLLAGVNPSQLYHTSIMLPEMLLCFAITTCWILVLFFIYNSGNFFHEQNLVLIGTISGLAALIKPVWLLGILPILISILLLNKNKNISFIKISTSLIGTHFLIIFLWDGINYFSDVKLQKGKTLTVNICMASIRSGLIKYGEGTPIYEHLKNNGDLKKALALNGEDNKDFRNIYKSLSWQQKYDTQFVDRIIKYGKLEFVISQLKYWHYFFKNRMFSPNKTDSFIYFPEIGKKLYVVIYSYFYRPIMPMLLIFSTVIIFFNRKYRPLVLTSVFILIYFSLVVILFSKSQSSVMRMRVPVEIILFICSTYPMIDLLKNYFIKLMKNKKEYIF